MNLQIRRLTWGLSLIAFLIITGVHTAISIPLGFMMTDGPAGNVSLLAVIGIACWMAFKNELAERTQSNKSVLNTQLVLALTYLVSKKLLALLSFAIAVKLRFLAYPNIQTLLSLSFLFVFLKSATELSPLVETQEREYNPRGLIFGLTVFFAVSITFIPLSWLPFALKKAAEKGEMSTHPSLITLIHWVLAFASAYLLVTKAQIDKRIEPDRPGLTMLKSGWVLGIVIIVISVIAGFFGLALQSGELILALLTFAIAVGPVIALAKLLLTFGALKLLFNLQSAQIASSELATSTSPAKSSTASLLSNPVTPIAENGPTVEESQPAREEVTHNDPVRDLENEYPLRAAIKNDPLNVRLHDRLHRALATNSERSADLLQHAKSYLAALLGHSMKAEALSLLRSCIAIDPTFKPAADQIWPMVRILLAEKDAKAALRIMSRFDAENPGHPHTPQIYYLCARILVSMQQPDRAKQLIQFLLKQYPDDKAASDAKTLLSTLHPIGAGGA